RARRARIPFRRRRSWLVDFCVTAERVGGPSIRFTSGTIVGSRRLALFDVWGSAGLHQGDGESSGGLRSRGDRTMGAPNQPPPSQRWTARRLSAHSSDCNLIADF